MATRPSVEVLGSSHMTANFRSNRFAASGSSKLHHDIRRSGACAYTSKGSTPWMCSRLARSLVEMLSSQNCFVFDVVYRKKWCQVIAAPVTQNQLSKPEDLMLQHTAPLRKSAPGPPTALMKMSLLRRCTIPAPATENNIWTFKSEQTCVFSAFLTLKCASRHNGVHFFDIPTSKSGPSIVRLYNLTSKCASRHNSVHFFNIATSKKGSSMLCFFSFWLRYWGGPPLEVQILCTFPTPKTAWNKSPGVDYPVKEYQLQNTLYI